MDSRYGAFFIAVIIFLFCVTSFAVDGQDVNTDEQQTFDSLVWSDEFESGALDTSKWSYENGTGKEYYPFMDGWGNNELQYYCTENVTVEKGNLVIATTYKRKVKEGKNYFSGKIVTKGKFDVTYGRVEARIKLPYGDVGLWPAFWMMGSNAGEPPEKTKWAECGEIDIMEQGGATPMVVGCTQHYTAWPNNRHEGSYAKYSGKDYHVFRVDWTEKEIKGYIDDSCYHTFAIDNPEKEKAFVDNPLYILLNVAVGGDYPRSDNPIAKNYRKKDIKMYVDWVRVYK